MNKDLLQLFPVEQRPIWESILPQVPNPQEIRLRAQKPISILSGGKERFFDIRGNETDKPREAYRICGRELMQVLNHICHYSLYAFEDELKQGFITVAGGHRVGVTGQVVMENEKVRTIKNISCMNIRIAHEIRGAADHVLEGVYQDGRLLNTLIISPPGCGKTTLLRDLVRQISDGNRYGVGCCVGIVDERSEIAGCFQGIPQNDVGMRTDVLDGCPKALGMMMLLRSMSPQVIAVDEIGSIQDMEALHMVSCCGCKILATVHGDGIWDVQRKEGMERLFRENMFERFLVLGRRQGKFTVKMEEYSE